MNKYFRKSVNKSVNILLTHSLSKKIKPRSTIYFWALVRAGDWI